MTTFHGQMNGAGLRIALVCSRFNDLIVGRLEAGARDALTRHGTDAEAIDTVWVPGAWEIPMAAQALATYHFEVIANQSAAGLTRVAHDTGLVVTNGIITVDTMDQALERAGSKAGNKGADAALAALETVNVIRAALAP